MARTTLTKTTAPGFYSNTGTTVTFTAADTVNGNQYLATGRELVIARNTGGSTYSLTIQGSPDPYNRSSVAVKNIASGETAVFGPFPNLGWQQSDGYVYLDASSSSIEIAVIVLPY